MNVASLFAAPLDVLGGYVLPFLLVLTVIVFVHEFRHFLVARWCKVDVEVFSIGSAANLGWQDRHGTRWKVCCPLPLLSNLPAMPMPRACPTAARTMAAPRLAISTANRCGSVPQSWSPGRPPTTSWPS